VAAEPKKLTDLSPTGGRAPAAESRFNAEKAAVGFATFSEIPPPPEFIIDGMLPADIGVMSAPGGSSKSTFQLWQAIHIILGRPFLGRQVLRKGPVLIVTAEDPRRRIRYRLHHVAQRMGLSEQELETVGEQLLVEDVTGTVCRLAALLSDGNLYPTEVVDELIATYKTVGLSLAVLDPYVYFQPGERLVNDADSIMAQIGARLVRELACAVGYVAHSGKANAREQRSDQYASRGGSALPDGMRMVQVLTLVGSASEGLPDCLDPADVAAGRILRLSVPKLTDAAPITEPFWLHRDGFSFRWIEPVATDPREAQRNAVRALRGFLEAQLVAGIRHSQRSLEAARSDLGLSRDRLRTVLNAAFELGAIVLKDLPDDQRGRGKSQYLAPGAAL
jgi:hypothetical protein